MGSGNHQASPNARSAKAGKPSPAARRDAAKARRREQAATEERKPAPAKPTHRWVLVLGTNMKKRMCYLPIER
jgi:hypothetical protein